MAVDGQAGMDGERVWAAGAAGGEASSHGHGLIAIISLQEKTFAQTLCTSPIPKVHIHKIPLLDVSICRHVGQRNRHV